MLDKESIKEYYRWKEKYIKKFGTSMFKIKLNGDDGDRPFKTDEDLFNTALLSNKKNEITICKKALEEEKQFIWLVPYFKTDKEEEDFFDKITKETPCLENFPSTEHIYWLTKYSKRSKDDFKGLFASDEEISKACKKALQEGKPYVCDTKRN